MKKKFFSLILSAIVVQAAVFAQQVLDVNINTLVDDMENNAARAYQLYHNKTIRTTGYVQSIDSDSVWLVRSTNVQYWELMPDLLVLFNSSEFSKLINLNKGQRITIRGVYNGSGVVHCIQRAVIETTPQQSQSSARPATPQPAPQPAPAPRPAPAPQATPAPRPTQQPAQVAQPVAPPVNTQSNSMVRIQGGTFMMGSPANEAGRRNDEGPQHRVTVSSFYIGKYELTQKEYQEVTGVNPSKFKGDNFPVEQVTWYDAIDYCNKRSQKEGLTPAYTVNGRNVTWNTRANGYRLPTEAEWEYACRSGTTTAYNTGVSISDNTGWYDANSGDRTHPVGQKAANAWGLYDMHGNVFEWCWDWSGNYSSEAQTDPRGVEERGPSWSPNRMQRGGCYGSPARLLRSACRPASPPASRTDVDGFRLVRNVN